MAGNFISHFGTFGSGDGQFNTPTSITSDQDGRIIIADRWNQRIQVFDSHKNFLFKFGSKGKRNGQFDNPSAVACDQENNIIVTDTLNHRIQVFDSNGNFIRKFGSNQSYRSVTDGEFSDPHGIVVDDQNNIIVSDCGNHRVQIFNHQGRFKTKINVDQFSFPVGVTIDSQGRVIIAELGHHRIQIFGN